MNRSDRAAASGPGRSSPRSPRVLLVYAPSEQAFAATCASDLRQRGIAVKHEAATNSASALLRLTQMGEPPDWLVAILSPAALWSPAIAEEMRAATAMLRQKRIYGALALFAVPCSHGSIPLDWPIALSVDATHDYSAALDLLIAALDVAGSPTEARPANPAHDEAAHVSQLRSTTDAAHQETVRMPSVAGTPDPSEQETTYLVAANGHARDENAGHAASSAPDAASVTNEVDIAHQETAYVAAVADPSREETTRVPSLPSPSDQETTRLPSVADTASEATIRIPSFGRAAPVAPVSLTVPEPPTPASRVRPAGSASPAELDSPAVSARKLPISRRTLLGVGAVIAASALAGGGAYVWRSRQQAPPLPGPAVRWRYRVNSTVMSAAVEANGRVYFGADNGAFYALDAVSHQLRWTYNAGAIITRDPPVVTNDAVYFCASDGSVYKLKDDPASGEPGGLPQWRFQRPGVQTLPPALYGDVVYVATRYRRFYALDSASGAVRWQAKDTFNPSSPPLIADNRIYIAATNVAYALDTDGVEIWRNPAVGAVTSQMATANGLLYITALDGTVFALDAATGVQRWRFAADGKIYIMPVVDTHQGAVYIGDLNSYLYALDATSGALRWRQKLDSPVLTPCLVNGQIYAVSAEGYLYALDPSAGAVRWQYVVGEGAVSPLGAGARTLYLDSADHYFYALVAS